MRKKRRRRAIGPWAASVLLLAAALALLLVKVVFVVRDVQVVGNGSLAAEDVLRISGIRLGSRLGAVDEEHVRECVESDGRLAFISLERRLPNHVILTVRQRSRDALVLQGGKVLVLDSDGYVVEVTDRLPESGIPYVTGLKPATYQQGSQLDTTDGRVACLKAILEAAKARGAFTYIAEIDVSNMKNLRAITRTGLTVILGDSGNMDNKMIWMAGAVADLEARGETTGRLDVASGSKADYLPRKRWRSRNSRANWCEKGPKSVIQRIPTADFASKRGKTDLFRFLPFFRRGSMTTPGRQFDTILKVAEKREKRAFPVCISIRIHV